MSGFVSAIRYYADFQVPWDGVIPPLKKHTYRVEGTDQLSIAGDAPKNIIWIKEYQEGRTGKRRRCVEIDATHPKRRSGRRPRAWVAHIAKVGSKMYPIESITEHFMTRIGEIYRLKIAKSQLRMVFGQVRFLSRYFLTPRESLVHGLEIFRSYLDEDMVDAIADRKAEKEYYTFKTVVDAIRYVFPSDYNAIMTPFVEMLAFDALVGNNDRHPANWGVISPIHAFPRPRFSPIFDTARGLFWNVYEAGLAKFIANRPSLVAYVNRSVPQIGFDGEAVENHFDLVRLIYLHYPEFRPAVDKLAADNLLECRDVLEGEFERLMTPTRRRAICLCLAMRRERFLEAIQPPPNCVRMEE